MRKEIFIAAIAIMIIICAGAFAASDVQVGEGISINLDLNALEDGGNLVVDSEDISKEKEYFTSSAADENAVFVKNGGALKLINSFINKTGDTASTGDDADFYGINSAILVNSNGTLDISNVEIETNSKGSNGIFVTNGQSSSSQDSGSSGNSSDLGGSTVTPGHTTDAEEPGSGGSDGGAPDANGGSGAPDSNGGNGSGAPDANGGSGASDANGGSGGTPPSMPGSDGGSGGGSSDSSADGTSQANIENVKITTHSDKSRGLDATYNGIINAKKVEINTNGQSCAALATDRGEGEVHVSDSVLNTGVDKQSGRGSPIIYSTGNITVEDSTGCAYVSQIACIEGKNSIELTGCDLSAAAGGNREDNGEYVDLGGVFIYQSMSGDADVGTSTFTAKDSTLSIESDSEYYKTAPMFHVTNTKAVVNLEGTELNFGSGVLLNISGQNQWGTEGSNGGDLVFNANSEILDGDVIVDSISSLNMSLASTSFVGAINPSGDFGDTSLSIDSGSDWTLDGDSYLSSLDCDGKIEYNGHTLYVGGTAYTESNPFK